MKNLEKISCILWNGVLIGLGLLIYSAVMTILFSDFAYSIHTLLYEMPRDAWQQMMFLAMAIMKIMWLMIFVIPYISIRLYLRKHSD